MNILDKDNFEEFVKKNSRLFYAFGRKYIDDHYLIEDIIQDSFVTLWTKMENHSNINDAKLYMFSMIKNKIINRLKKEKRISYFEIHKLQEQSAHYIYNNILESESTILIREALEKLPENSKKVINLYLEGLNNEEISEKLDMTIDSVKSHKKRSVKKLKDILPRELHCMFFTVY